MSGHRKYTQRFKVKVSELIYCFARWKFIHIIMTCCILPLSCLCGLE